jgi:SOS response regulatory protein OraA/RecX
MAVFKPEIKETTEDRLQKAINLGREEALKEVIEWLDENFYTSDIEFADSYLPEYVLNGNFESKEQMLQSFKERFNIE